MHSCALHAQALGAAAERDALTCERAQLAAQAESAGRERDALGVEVARLKGEREDLGVRLQQLQVRLDARVWNVMVIVVLVPCGYGMLDLRVQVVGDSWFCLCGSACDTV